MKADSEADFKDRHALVTGATAGIGFHTARRLATRGATVLVTGRNPRRGAEAEGDLRRAAGHERVEFIRVDHSTVAANVALAEELRSRLARLDFLVNNVGGLVPSRVVTHDGNELTLALNFITPFALTESLAPLMLESDSSRCVNVISSAFKMAKGDPFVDLQSERSYVPPGLGPGEAARVGVDRSACGSASGRSAKRGGGQPGDGVDPWDPGHDA